MNRPRIIAVHLLNDFSGSPFVFSQALQALQKNGYDVHLFTATPSGNGFLNAVKGVHWHAITYRWSRIKLLTLLFFVVSQLTIFLKLVVFTRKGDIVYVNSMLPFGAALAGRLKGCRIVYHIHEVSVRPLLLKRWLLQIVDCTATTCVYVSKYLQNNTPISTRGIVIYNALPQAFIQQALQYKPTVQDPFTVLMLCSLKKYKGVLPFIECARRLPATAFVLVLNAREDDIQLFFKDEQIPSNCAVFPAQQQVHPFYEKAAVVVNFSLIDEWVETFGMTMLEAMYYRKPVIIPPVGGITELVTHGVNGFLIDSRDIPALVHALRQLQASGDLYEHMSAAAFSRAAQFSHAAFEHAIVRVIDQVASIEEQHFIVNPNSD